MNGSEPGRQVSKCRRGWWWRRGGPAARRSDRVLPINIRSNQAENHLDFAVERLMQHQLPWMSERRVRGRAGGRAAACGERRPGEGGAGANPALCGVLSARSSRRAATATHTARCLDVAHSRPLTAEGTCPCGCGAVAVCVAVQLRGYRILLVPDDRI